MKRNISILSIVSLSLILFQNCEKKSAFIEGNHSKYEENKPKPVVVNIDSLSKIKYSLEVDKIDSIQYFSVKGKIKLRTNSVLKITDFKKAKKLLTGIVDFKENKDFDEYHAVKQINFRNGTHLTSPTEFDFTFVAYYPDEDILLCEGGHSSDVSYHLATGKETEETGNPDLIMASPQQEFRLNGNFGGQECYSYFIQRKINNEFVKIIQLDEEFEKLTKVWLCTVGESFWSDERTLYITETDFVDNGIAKQYFKVKIIENYPS